jgi:DNA-binding SARP family transcriptional activator
VDAKVNNYTYTIIKGKTNLDEKTKLILVRCARVYFTTKNWEKAIKEYSSLMTEFPDDPNIIEPLAKSYYEAGNKEKAKELYEKVKSIYESKAELEKAQRVQKDIERYFQ